ncbi:MAG: hypothetical protein SNF86_06805 [Rikenellaceae bacterium]
MKIKLTFGKGEVVVVDSMARAILKHLTSTPLASYSDGYYADGYTAETGEQISVEYTLETERTYTRRSSIYANAEFTERKIIQIEQIEVVRDEEIALPTICNDPSTLHAVISSTEYDEHKSTHSA